MNPSSSPAPVNQATPGQWNYQGPRGLAIPVAVLGLGLAFMLPAKALTLIEDTFTTAEEVETYTPKAVGEPVLSWDSEVNALSVISNTNGQYFTKPFENGALPVILARAGDSLQLTADWSAIAASGGFRLGFFNSRGSGYAISIGTPMIDAGQSSFKSADFGADNGALDSASNRGMDIFVPQQLTFSITRQENGDLRLEGTWSTPSGGGESRYTFTVPAAEAQYQFDRISFCMGPSSGVLDSAYQLTNIVATASTSEP